MLSEGEVKVIIAPDLGDTREAIVSVRGDGEGCGYGESEDDGCADKEGDKEKLHFDDGVETEMAGREVVFVSSEGSCIPGEECGVSLLWSLIILAAWHSHPI